MIHFQNSVSSFCFT